MRRGLVGEGTESVARPVLAHDVLRIEETAVASPVLLHFFESWQ